MGETIIGILVVVGVIGMYITTYIWNKNTPVPEGVKVAPKCSTCNSAGCSLSTINMNHTLDSAKVVDELRELIEESESNCKEVE